MFVSVSRVVAAKKKMGKEFLYIFVKGVSKENRWEIVALPFELWKFPIRLDTFPRPLLRRFNPAALEGQKGISTKGQSLDVL